MAVSTGGDFAVVWQSQLQDANPGCGVYAQRYNAAGSTVGNEFLVNRTTTGNQSNPAVAIDDSGRIAVAWDGNAEGDATGVFVQRFDPAPSLLFSLGDGTDDPNMTFSGSIADVNAALENLTFIPTASYTGPASLRIQTSDLGQTGTGGTKTDDDTVQIDVALMNSADLFDGRRHRHHRHWGGLGHWIQRGDAGRWKDPGRRIRLQRPEL